MVPLAACFTILINTAPLARCNAKVTQASCLIGFAGFLACEMRHPTRQAGCMSNETGWKPVLLLTSRRS